MSAFEALLRDAPAVQEEGGSSQIAAPLQRSRVEWAIAWGDGRLTGVSSEDAARYIAARHPAWSVVCRFVGGWTPA
jgi:hypothetical protein